MPTKKATTTKTTTTKRTTKASAESSSETLAPKKTTRTPKVKAPQEPAVPLEAPKEKAPRKRTAQRVKADESKPAKAPSLRSKEPEPVEPAKSAAKAPPTPRRTKAGTSQDTPKEGLAVISWRSKDSAEAEESQPRRKTRRSSAKPEADATEEADAQAASVTRKSRRGKADGDRASAELSPRPAATGRARRSEKPATEPPAQALPQEAATRTVVAIPKDAPQVVDVRGVPTLIVRERAILPISFYTTAPDEQRLATALDEIRLATARGVSIISLGVDFYVEPEGINQAVVECGFLLRQVAAVAPSSSIVFRLSLRPPEPWVSRYKRAAYVTEDGNQAEPSVCDDGYWGDAEEFLKAFVRKLRKVDTGSQVIGLHLDRGEWYYADGEGYDTSIAAQEGFRQWLRHRYSNDVVSLRAAWFNGSSQFETIAVPEFRELSRNPTDFVRTDRKARPWVDYHLFLSDAVCDRLARLAMAVKEASEGYFLVGVSYGYTFEWSHPASGHLALGKLLRIPEIDYISGPPSYRNREPGKSGAFPTPVDSYALNGKLFISEDDFKTSISGVREPDEFNPAFRTPQALESAQWRGVGAALAHGTGVSWMDRWGNGWLSPPGIWQRGETVQRALAMRLAAPQAAPDVAMLVDERSLAYLLDAHAFEVLIQSVYESLLRSGLSVGFYLLSDLGHREQFPDSKLYVFVNAWDIRREVRTAIKGRLQRDGKTLFWLYSAGLFEGGRESLERVREVTGIALRPQPFNYGLGTTLLNQRDPRSAALPADKLASDGKLEPSYFAIPEGGQVLGEYTQTGLPSFVVDEFTGDAGKRWTSVFLGEPVVGPAFFRALADQAGIHIWSFHDDVVHVRPPFLCVHCAEAGDRTIALPEKNAAYSLTSGAWVNTDGNRLTFHSLAGQSHMFLVGSKSEIEHLIEVDPVSVTSAPEFEPRDENTVHWNELKFDVPIMRLDEWVEEAWGEELADDFLIKPSMFETVPESGSSEDEIPASRGGGRQRTRRRRAERGERRVERIQSEEDSMHVLFRKRK
ncbi:MAG: beta-galactosidase [Fimbriimonadaceae bacterium]|nr:beta-galactosidase [Fimbriimonadaceae bacterium]